MSRILFLGDLAGTGFGTVTMDLGRALLARGEDVRFLSLNEKPGALPEPFASRTALMGAPDGWLGLADPEQTQARLAGMFTGSLFEDGWTPDAGIIIGDVVALKLSPVRSLIPEGFPVFHYCPIEGVGLPPRWAEVWRATRPVAMSEFGAEEIAKLTGSRPPVVYHGVDTHVFRPISAIAPLRLGGAMLRSRDDARRFFGGDPSRTWLLRTDRNMPRKRYNALLRSLFPVFARNDQIDLVIHCLTADQGGDLADELSKYPAWFQARVLLTGFHDRMGGASREVLVALYNAADVYVSNAAEGFGLCIAEALACGTPAVGVGYSAVPEVIGPAGVTVPEGGLVDNEYNHFWWAADEQAFGLAVEDLATHPLRRQHLGQKGPDHIRKNFRWDTAAQQFSELVGAAMRQEVVA